MIPAYTQVPDKETLMKYVSTGNAGTEFWVTFPPSYQEESQGAANAIVVYVASPVSQPVTVEVPGKGYFETKMVKANDVVEFRFTPSSAEPYYKKWNAKAPPEKVYAQCGVHISAQSPIVVYGMTRFWYTSDGFLAVPVSKLGTDYIIASYPQYTAIGSGHKLPSLSNIVAAYDNTTVTFTMGGTTGSITTGGLKPGQSSQWTLNAGDVLCFANDDDGQDISGSRVVSDKPVGVVSGNQCANVPQMIYSCDFIDEMELPIKTWGKEYHVTPIKSRLFNSVIRVFAHPDYKDVKVYRDGVEWKTLSNKSRLEGEAFFEERAADGSPRPVIITASAPIYVVLYNTGQTDDNVTSDPFQMVLTPVEQYQTEITFATPAAKGAMAPFDRNHINLVYPMGEGNTVPEDFEFATVNNGQFEWRTVKSRFGSSTGRVFAKKSSNGEEYAVKMIDLPSVGVYKIRAKKPFAAYAYGFSNYDSYGFPTSASVLDASIIDTTPPTITVTETGKNNWSGLAEDVYSGIAGVKADNIATSNSGIIASVCLLADSSENVNLIVDKSQTFKALPAKWSLVVEDVNKSARAIIVVSDNAGNYTYRTFNYKPNGIIVNVENPITLTCDLTFTEKKIIKPILYNVNPDKAVEIVECTTSDDNSFMLDLTQIVGKVVNPSSQLDIPIVFEPKQVGNYSTIIKIKVKENDSVTLQIVAKVVRTSLKTEEKIVFDTTFIENVSNSDRKITMTSEIGLFYLPATVVDIRSLPIGGVEFEKDNYGSEGFQIDKDILINKTIDDKVNYKIDVPVKFKAVKEGLHKATVFLYPHEGKPLSTIELIGYGKKEVTSSVEDENSTDLSVFTNTTTKEIVVQGKSLSEMKEYSIINQIGEVSLSGTISVGTESLTIPIQNLPAGMYIFTAEVGGKKVQEKFVIMR